MDFGSFPATVTPYGSAIPVPESTITVRWLVLQKDGGPAPGTELHLTLDSVGRRVGMLLRAAPAAAGSDSIVVTADAKGFASAAISFGRFAGHAVLRVRVPTLGIEDTLGYELGGTVGAIDVSPVPLMYPGESRTLTWRVTSSLGGPQVFANPTFSVDAPAIGTLSTDTLHAVGFGTTWVRGTAGGISDSSTLVVVPQGRLGAVISGTWTLFDMNGANVATQLNVSAAFADARYSPSGDTLAYFDGARIQLRLPTGAIVRAVPAALGFAFDRHPAWSADGQWIYFTAGYAGGRSEIWRIMPNGTNASRVGPVAAAGEADSEPTVNPGLTRVAFTTNRVLAGGLPTVRIINAGTGATVFGGTAGSAARYAPDGTKLAFRQGGQVVRTDGDGAGLVSLVPALTLFTGQLAWSPDSRWIVAQHGTLPASQPYLHLLDTSTNTAIRLLYSFNHTVPEWR